MALHNELGTWGENIAARYMQDKGWYIRHRDWRNKHRDLDIVVIDADMTTLVIVEVKTRATDSHGEPASAVDLEKQHNVMRAAAHYMEEFALWHLTVRYDIISIVGKPGSQYTIEHIEDAFDMLSQHDFSQYMKKTARMRHNEGKWK